MKNVKRVVALACTLTIAAGLFAGCGKKADNKPAADGKLPTGQTITLWSHLNDDEIAAVKVKAEEWAKKTNNTVKVVKDNGKFEALVTAAKSPAGPDVMYGYPHNNIANLIDAKVAAEIPSGTIDEAKFTQASLDAGKYQGKQYALPIVAETYALFYNKDLVKDSEVPKTWDELIALGKKVGFEYDINNFYFSYAVLAGNGAYVFKNNNGQLDPKDIGLGGAEAAKGLAMIKGLVDAGLMKASINDDIAKGDFANKKTGLYISGPWAVSGEKGFKAQKLNFGVVELPSIEGKATPSFMGVQVGAVNSNSKNKELSMDLMKYLENNALDAVVKCGRMPVTKDGKYEDTQTIGFADQVKNAQPMPNIPEMDAVWGPGGDTLKLVTTGKLAPDAAAKQMLENINKGIANKAK